MIRTGFLAAPFRIGLRPFAKFMKANSLMEHGRGRGSALVADSLAQADSAGVPCYLETSSERNLAFYGRHGFAVVETVTLGDGGPTGWAMRRDPQNLGEPASRTPITERA